MTFLGRVIEGTRSGFIRSFESLSVPRYRLLWLGMLFSIGAMQIELVAIAWLAYHLSGSGLTLGLVMAARGLPQLILSPYSGVAADRYDKRQLLVWSQSAVTAVALVTAALVHTGVIEVWHLVALGLAQGVATPFTMPTRTALIPDLVPERQIPNALALESTGRNINRVVAPAISGVLLAINPAWAFYAIALVYGLAALTLYRLPSGLRGEGAKGGVFREMGSGFLYIWARPSLFALMTLAYVPILIGMPFQSLLPIFQQEVLRVNERALGFMFTSIGVGAIIGSIVVAAMAESPHKARVQIGCGVVFGFFLLAFALSRDYWLSIVLLLLVGFFSTGYLTLNRMLVGMQTERAMYGRVMAIYGMTWSVMPIALLPYGALVDVFGVSATVAGGGILVSVFIAAVALSFSRYYLRNPIESTAPGRVRNVPDIT
ncbi:MAG TPA: MFS transporter [Thermomicrobiales bacterium]|nr:MFS transporter [Thermomicrobiales bacterium]